MNDNEDSATLALYYPTWKKYICLNATVERLSVREKRRIFAIVRNQYTPSSEHTLLLMHGITLGDFCAMHILCEYAKR